ncbi:MAG TPA: hypothetical protein PLD47_05525 [Aggregatilineales bacterium]|nr:hypothetical protein [Anaerolineales bacterium]HRE47166.1 hypothetical protein [Aggregatilineales bacterium]
MAKESKRDNQRGFGGRLAKPRPPRPPFPQWVIQGLTVWIARRRRPTRIVLAAVLALVMGFAGAVLVFGILFSIDAERFAGIDPYTLNTVIVLGMIAFGFFCYWIGWRVMVGFDFEETPLQPTRTAALWVLFVAGFAFVVALLSLIAVAVAFSPVQ